jgi:hypothetical protein
MTSIYAARMPIAETPPGEDEFARLLVWAYRGEVQGEAMFDALAGAWAVEGRGRDLLVLAELERQMALALVPLLRRYALDGGDDERSRRVGRESAAAIAGAGWDDFLNQFAPATDAALERYHRLRDLAPEPERVIDELIAHEEALQAYAAAATRGDGGRSLEPVQAAIERLSSPSD